MAGEAEPTVGPMHPDLAAEYLAAMTAHDGPVALVDEPALCELLGREPDRLLVQANYLDRQGRRDLAALLRDTVRKARTYDRLNDFTKEIADAAYEVGVPIGCEISVSADSDVLFARPDGHWIGLRRRERPRRWEAWRGSLYRADRSFETLREAVRYHARMRHDEAVPDPE